MHRHITSLASGLERQWRRTGEALTVLFVRMRGADGLFDCFAEFGAGAKLDDVFGRYPDRGSVARVPSGSCMFPLYCEGAESGQGDFFAADERGGCYFHESLQAPFRFASGYSRFRGDGFD